jgi:hypothetical protein
LDALNTGTTLQRYTRWIAGRRRTPVESAAPEWHVEFLPDPDGDLAEGAIVIDSELRLPAALELDGDRTRRITTVHRGEHITTRSRIVNEASAVSATRVFAQLAYEDDSGQHEFDVVKDSITVGRGGITYPVDVRIASSADVSREHARIRRDAMTGRFFLIDLSSLGTTLNGRHVPRGFEEVDGSKRENGVDTALPDQARIGLADTVYLRFQLCDWPG